MEKVNLPTKTKIAAWWMIVFGGIYLIVFLFALMYLLKVILSDFHGGIAGAYVLGFLILVLMVSGPGILFFLSGLFLLSQRKKWTYKLAIIILPIGIISLLFFGVRATLIGPTPSESQFLIPFVIPVIIFIIPFILLFLDRKNFWKVAS